MHNTSLITKNEYNMGEANIIKSLKITFCTNNSKAFILSYTEKTAVYVCHVTCSSQLKLLKISTFENINQFSKNIQKQEGEKKKRAATAILFLKMTID